MKEFQCSAACSDFGSCSLDRAGPRDGSWSSSLSERTLWCAGVRGGGRVRAARCAGDQGFPCSPTSVRRPSRHYEERCLSVSILSRAGRSDCGWLGRRSSRAGTAAWLEDRGLAHRPCGRYRRFRSPHVRRTAIVPSRMARLFQSRFAAVDRPSRLSGHQCHARDASSRLLGSMCCGTSC